MKVFTNKAMLNLKKIKQVDVPRKVVLIDRVTSNAKLSVRSIFSLN